MAAPVAPNPPGSKNSKRKKKKERKRTSSVSSTGQSLPLSAEAAELQRSKLDQANELIEELHGANAGGSDALRDRLSVAEASLAARCGEVRSLLAQRFVSTEQ